MWIRGWKWLGWFALFGVLLTGCRLATDEPTVVIAPQEGPPGTTVQVSADGFDANTDVQIGAGLENAEFAVRQSVQSNAQGRVDAEITIPETAEPGGDWVVVARAIEPDGERATSGTFNVVEPEATEPESTVTTAPTDIPVPTATSTPMPTATATSAPTTTPDREPAVAISPLSGPPGTNIQVTASGFPANTEVQVGAGREGSEFGVTKTAQTDAAGRLSTTITLPDFAEIGDPWGVVVRIVEQGGVRASSGTFQVTAPDEDSGNLFERTQIYLIAVGDEGGSGKQIGCGDSVIPVEVAIEPTIAPLTAGLEKLLAIDEEYYGQSGLYNALHSSDLAVEGINIENREAIIRLTGELLIGGVCDEPRIRAQIEETALQFSTVDRVSIFINGKALETYFGQGGS
jgi:hypothetical protein